jgi:PAS domain-containing protein
MSGPPIELLLLKQVAGYLAMPVFLIDEDGALEYYNEPAEELLGQRYEETGQIPLESWGKIWAPTDLDGRPLAPEEVPVAVAGRERRPVLGIVSIRRPDGSELEITITALPFEAADGSHLGAFAFFWASDDGETGLS